MQTDPEAPAGRPNRKARAFEAEIVRLRAEGYSCVVIREALADVGVNVSVSTVWREAARRTAAPPVATSGTAVQPG